MAYNYDSASRKFKFTKGTTYDRGSYVAKAKSSKGFTGTGKVSKMAYNVSVNRALALSGTGCVQDVFRMGRAEGNKGNGGLANKLYSIGYRKAKFVQSVKKSRFKS